MNLLQDIFRILHQPVQLLIAALMFAYKEPKRKFWLIRAVLAAILGFLVLKLCITASPEILLNSFLTSLVWSIGSFLILLSIEYSMFDVKLKMAAYFTTLAYLTQHVAFCAWDAIQPGAGYFIRDKLHLEMSEEKTLITHGHDAAKFLGYEVTIAKGEHNKKTKTVATRRVNNGKVLLYVPHDKWVKRLFSYNALKIKYDKQNGNKEVWEPVRRTRLLHLDDLEILNQYNAEIRGLYNYYRLANNVSVLNNFYYVMRYSMLKTFAGKYRTRISRIIRKYRQGKDFVVEYPKKNGKVGKVLFYNNGFRRDTKVESGNPDIVARIFENYGRNSLIKRLQANRCEWCGAENVPLEIHHIRKLKDLSGRKQWEIAMIGRKRKTMALCIDCHDKLHAGKLD